MGVHPDAVPEIIPTTIPQGQAPEPQAPPPIPPSLPVLELDAPKAEAAAEEGQASASKKDASVKPTAADATMVRSEVQPRNLQEAGAVAARVGDEVITKTELRLAIRDQLKNMPPGEQPSQAELNMLARATLQDLIKRSVIVQEAKRELKDPKKVQTFLDHADKIWHEEELEPLLRRFAVANEYELKPKLEERGLDLAQMREAYRRKFLAQNFLRSKLISQMTVTLPEMRDYYNEHLHDFDRPAQVTWREVVIELDKSPSRAAAKARADSALARLRRGEDFAVVARAASDGPNRSKGGLWETTPNGYAVESVNEALKSLPMGQISQVIEGPSSYHIVRVEGRRPAGPATFPEVQEKVNRAVYEHKTDQAMSSFIDKLLSRTLISSAYDISEKTPTPGGPAPAR